MRVVKQFHDGQIHVELLDDDGTAIPTVSPFLRHLSARGYSPNTLLVGLGHIRVHVFGVTPRKGKNCTLRGFILVGRP